LGDIVDVHLPSCHAEDRVDEYHIKRSICFDNWSTVSCSDLGGNTDCSGGRMIICQECVPKLVGTKCPLCRADWKWDEEVVEHKKRIAQEELEQHARTTVVQGLASSMTSSKVEPSKNHVIISSTTGFYERADSVLITTPVSCVTPDSDIVEPIVHIDHTEN
jgi:hypothetical protein